MGRAQWLAPDATVTSLLLVTLFSASCLEPTQVTFDITTDVPCDQVSGTSISVGVEGETEKSAPVKVTTECASDGTVSAIGTYAARPRTGQQQTASFKVAVALSSGVSVERDCIAAKGYRGCIVARRRVSFVAHRSLRIPVSLISKCLNIQCDQNSSCAGNGTCSTSEVDVSRCGADGQCTILATRADTGLPCFNEEGETLFCSGTTNWCTREMPGEKACGMAPAGGGVSYQCRNSRDCGANLKCVGVSNQIQGQCMVDVTPGFTLLCTPDDTRNSCGLGYFCPLPNDGGSQICEIAPDSGIAVGPVDAGPPINWVQQAFIKASNPDRDDNFGDPVALSASGDTLAVGAWTESSCATGVNGNQTNNGCQFAGAAYVFQRANGQWVQEAYLKSNVAGPKGRFGFGLALSADGQILAVSAWKEDSARVGVDGPVMPPTKNDSGAVYLFKRVAGVWTPGPYIRASNPDSLDFFGIQLTMSRDGRTLAVAATGEDSNARGFNGVQNNNASSNSGAVYVFRETNGTWAQESYVKASNAEANDGFGGVSTSGRTALTLSDDGNVLAVGAPGEASAALGVNGDQNDNSMPGAGAVYVFRRTGTTWSQDAYLKATNTEAGDGFGIVSLSGDGQTLVVGAPQEDSAGLGVDSTQVDNSMPGAGAVYVFEHTVDGWAPTHYLKAGAIAQARAFGLHVGLSRDGQTLSVGALNDSAAGNGSNPDPTLRGLSGSGATYVFTRVGSTWAERTFQKASNPGSNEFFGVSTAWSDDTRTWAVGAHYEATDGGGINPPQDNKNLPTSGAVYVFSR